MSYSVIIVDDDNVAIYILEKLTVFSGLHSNPLSFLKAEDALKYIYENDSKEASFVVMLDINMPEINGWDFLDTTVKNTLKGNLYVVIVTSSVDTYDKELASKYNQIIHFFEKPLTLENLNTIKNHLSFNSKNISSNYNHE